MARPRWNGSLPRFGSSLAAVVAMGLAALLLRGERADACGWDGPSIDELTTFDPQIVDGGDGDGLYYNPYLSGYGGPCDPCLTSEMLADWAGYLKDAVTAADWQKILLEASAAELTALSDKLAGKPTAVPAGYERSSLWANAKARPQLREALALVKLARQVERLAGASSEAAPASPTTSGKPARLDLLALAKAGQRASKHPFLTQRYAFLALKILFYQREWGAAIEFAAKQAAVLATPSTSLGWRARYYVAGALLRNGERGRANLELARIHAAYPALAGAAANDFRPMEESDWRESLALAKTAKEKAELWRLVGITRDGVVAIREIQKLDPRSPLMAMLLARELERSESRTSDVYGMSPDPKGEALQKREFATLEQLAMTIAAAPGADRPWLATLMAGHLAAKRGDLAAAKPRLLAALAARPGDVRVKSQVKASLAMALALDGGGASKPAASPLLTRERGDAIAVAMKEIDPAFARIGLVRKEVRGTLAKAYAAAGKLVEAELLQPGFVAQTPATSGKWQDVSFLKALIARATQTASPFDAFLTGETYPREQLEQELALRYVVAGAFSEAAKVFAAGTATSVRLGTDPFVIHILDCHDCDHERYAEAPWTHASFAARLAELERTANGKGEPAAAAALALGNALYNITWYGNARVVLRDTHQAVSAPRAAERWYKRAYELSRSRELRAKAAFLAAKAELGSLMAAAEQAASDSGEYTAGSTDLPIPKTWFPVFETFADTRYYREVLSECSHFAAWTAHPH
jgi:hypothetical protein